MIRLSSFIFFLLIFLNLPALTSLLTEGTPDEKIDHIEFLVSQKKLTDKKNIKDISLYLTQENQPVLVRERAAWAIGQLNLRDQAKHLLKAANSPSLLIRSAALHSLARFRARSGLSTYKEIATNDPVLQMRQRAVLAMGLLRWEKAISPIVKLSDDPKEEIRAASVLAMAATHSDTNSFEELLKQMQKDESPYVQRRSRIGMDIIKRNRKKLRQSFSTYDADEKLFIGLLFHYHGKGSDLNFLKIALKKESNNDVRYELERAISGIKKRVARYKKRKAKAKAEQAKSAAQQQTSQPK